jgi:hypothetical protein
MPIVPGRESLFYQAFPGSAPNADSSSHEALIRQRLADIKKKFPEMFVDSTEAPPKRRDSWRPWRSTRA